jgi:hypothetical protein
MTQSSKTTRSQRKRQDDELIREREIRDDKLGRWWLKKHAPMRALEPTPKPKRHEQWQIRRQEQKQERQALARPLLRGVE